MAQPTIEDTIKTLYRARERRAAWEPLWQECARFGQPSRNLAIASGKTAGRRAATDLFDGTAADGVEQLAASLLAELTPPWSKWFAILPGFDLDPELMNDAHAAFQDATARMQAHFDRSNFSVEMHQCLLDLITFGTATLQFEEAPSGELSPYRFSAVPVSEILIDGNANGKIESQFRQTSQSLAEVAVSIGVEL